MSQSDVLAAWWLDGDEFTRRRLLRLREDDPLPADIALDLMMAGVTVFTVGEDDAGSPLYAVPDVLLELLAELRGQAR